MGDIAQRGNRLTFAKGGRAGYAVGSVVRKLGKGIGRALKGRKGRGKDFKTHGKDVPTMAAKGGRAGHAFGSLVHAATKAAKKYHKKKKLAEDTKKGKFPETESLTHQKGPYVGDVGSEGKKSRGIDYARVYDKAQKLAEKKQKEARTRHAKGGRAGFKRAGAVTKADLAKRDLWTKRELKRRANIKRKSKWDIKGGISGHPLNPLTVHAEIKSHEPWRKRSDVYTRTRDDLKKSRDTKLKGIGEAFQKMDYRDADKGTQFENRNEPKLKKQIHRMRGDTRPSGRVDREGLKKGKSPGRSQGPGRKGRRPWGGPKK